MFAPVMLHTLGCVVKLVSSELSKSSTNATVQNKITRNEKNFPRKELSKNKYRGSIEVRFKSEGQYNNYYFLFIFTIH